MIQYYRMKTKRVQLNTLLILALCLVYFCSYLTRLNFSATMVEIIASGVLTKTQAGMVGTALFITYGVGQLVSGVLGDKLRPNYIILFGLFLTSGCNLLLPFMQGYFGFIVVWAVNGLAQAMMWPPIVKILSEFCDKQTYGKACVWITAASQLATVAIYLLVPLCIRFLQWESVFFFAAAFALFAAAIWFFFYRFFLKRATRFSAEEEEKTSAQTASVPFYTLVLSCGLPFILAVIALQGLLKDGITSWLPTYLSEIFAVETHSAVLLNIATPIFSVCSVYLATFLYRKILKNEVKASLVFFSVACVCCIPLVMFSETQAVVCLIFSAIVVACMHAVNLMLISYLPRRFQKYGKTSTVSGITNACTYIGSAASSYGFALIANAAGWTTLIWIWGGVCILAGLLLLCSYKKWKKHIE